MPEPALSRSLQSPPKDPPAALSVVPGAQPLAATGSSRAWWLATALVVSTLFWMLAWYGDTVASVVHIWIRSETFAHGFLIVPISAWLIWRRRHAVMAFAATPSVLAVGLLMLAGLGWLLGELAEARVVQQFAVATMIPLVVWAALGTRVAWVLAFPLAYLLFAVPFGEFLERPLMEHTADFTVSALRLTGIPVYREGQHFMIPSGSWSVVEACSGLRYLIASLTLGVLYAYLMYRSLVRRAIFVLLSVVVPIVANWLRAYMIVMIGHLSDMKYAAGIDHLIYGWLFFGVVMLLLFWIGSFWREDLRVPSAPPPQPPLTRNFRLGNVLGATLVIVGIVAAWPVIASHIDRIEVPPRVALHAPQPSAGWQAVSHPLSDWAPRYVNPRVSVRQTYERGNSAVEIYIGYYNNQRQGAQLITSQNMLVTSNDRSWQNVGESGRALDTDSRQLPLVQTRLRGASSQLLVWRWYWVDGRYVVNPYWAKLLLAKSKLFDRADDAAVVIVSTKLEEPPRASNTTLGEFVITFLPEITRTLESARRH